MPHHVTSFGLTLARQITEAQGRQAEPGNREPTGCRVRLRLPIDDAGVIERILKHPGVWDPQPENRSPAGPDPPWPEGQTVPLSYHPVPDIA